MMAVAQHEGLTAQGVDQRPARSRESEAAAGAWFLLPWFGAAGIVHFGALLSAFFALRGLHSAAFLASQQGLDGRWALTAGVALIAGTLIASWGVVELGRGQRRRAAWLARGLIVIAVVFVALRAYEVFMLLRFGGLYAASLESGLRVFRALYVIMTGAHVVYLVGVCAGFVAFALQAGEEAAQPRVTRWVAVTYLWYHLALIWLVHYSTLYVLS